MAAGLFTNAHACMYCLIHVQLFGAYMSAGVCLKVYEDFVVPTLDKTILFKVFLLRGQELRIPG